MPLNLIEKWRGSSVLLNYSFIHGGRGEISKKTVIENLAVVRTEVNPMLGYFIQYKKINKEDDVKIVISVSCENPKYDEKFICTENWSAWREISALQGPISATAGNVNNLEINVSVRKIEKSKILEKNMYLDADFTDFCLSSMNGNVAVHKVVLASHSDVFKAMLNGEWKETMEGRIEVAGTTRECLDHLKDYMYLNIVPDEGLQPLLLVAKHYMIQNLKTRCIGKLVDSVTPETLYDLLDFASLNVIPELTYEILYIVPSKIVDKAYKLKKGIKTIDPKTEDTFTDDDY